MTRVNSLLCLTALATLCLLALSAPGARAGFDFFKKKDDKTTTTPAPAADQGEQQPQQHEQDELEEVAPRRHATSHHVGRPRRRPDLESIRQAQQEQERLAGQATPEAEAEDNTRRYPKRPTYQGRTHNVQGRGRNSQGGAAGADPQQQQQQAQRGRSIADEEDDDEVEDRYGYEAALEDYRANRRPDGVYEGNQDDDESGLMSRFKNKPHVRDQLAAKFVSTYKGGRPAGGSQDGSTERPKVSFSRVGKNGRLQPAPGSELMSSKFWGKKLNKAMKVTKQGIKASASALGDLPKYAAAAGDSINAFLQLDGKGKLLSLIDSVSSDIHFVRKEFSQFSLNWSPIMERSLNYLGDSNLNKIKWNERDELDLKKNALHALVIGYEFMRMMVNWREQLLMAHEAYKTWLQSVKSEYEAQRFDVDDDMIMQLSTIHNYLLLTSWEEINYLNRESRAKLDDLMEIEDDQPKNYESEYFRNIILLQEMYLPTVEEFDREQEQVRQSIATSGVVVENLEHVDEFFETFRKSIESGELEGVDCKVPSELRAFLDKLKPQIEYTPLVYTKGFLKELEEEREREARELADAAAAAAKQK